MAKPWSKKKDSKPWNKTTITPGMYDTPPGTEGATPVGDKIYSKAQEVIKSPLEVATAKGPGAVQRLKGARAMGTLNTIGKSFGNRMHKFGAGAKEIANEVGGVSAITRDMLTPDAIKGPIDEITNGLVFSPDQYISNNMELSAEEQDFDKQNFEFNQVKGVPGFVGDAAAYGLAELATGPISTKLTKGAMDTISEGATYAGREVAKESSAIAKWLQQQDLSALKKIGKFGEEKIGIPVKIGASRYAGRDAVGNPNRRGMVKDIVSGVGTGAATGALDYDLDVADGALSGAAGGVSGAALTRPLSKRFDANTKAGREVIDKMKANKYRVDPGVDLRNTAMYNKTRKLTSDDSTSEIMQTYADANQKVNNRMTYGAMGFSKPEIDNMTPKVFKEGIDRSKAEFDKMAAMTKGYIPKKSYMDMQTKLNDLAKNPTSSATAVKESKEVLDYLDANTLVTRDPATGRFRQASFDGKTYQQMRSTLKERIDKLYDAGDFVTANELRPVLGYLDDALEEGMKRGGHITPAQWADARERWAMGEILKTKGINSADMDVDPKQLFKAFKRDPRMMTDGGGRVKDLMTVGKFSELERKLNEKAGVLSGSHQSVKNSHSPGMLEEQKIKLHMSGYPSQYGLLGMNRYDGRYKPGTFTRPMSQAGQLYPNTIDAVSSAYDKATNPKQTIKDIIDWYNEDDKDKKR